MDFQADYIKDLPLDEIGEEEEFEFTASTWGHALVCLVTLVKAEANCPKGFLLVALRRTDVE